MWVIAKTLYKGSLNSHAFIQGTQSIGIHDVLYAQKFAMDYGMISNTVCCGKFSDVKESFTVKQKNDKFGSKMTSFLILNVLELKILQ